MYTEVTERQELEIAIEHVLHSGGAQTPVARDLLRKWALALLEEVNESLEVEQETLVAENGEATEVDWLLGLFRELTHYRGSYDHASAC